MMRNKFTPTNSNTQLLDHVMFHWRKIQDKRDKAEREYWHQKWDERKRETRQAMHAGIT